VSIPPDNPARKNRGRRLLGLLALLFLAPVAIAFFLYYGDDGWRPRGNVSHGDLIVPARPLPETTLPTPGGAHTDPRFLLGKWSLIYVGRLEDGQCDARCREALYQIRQVRLSLNEKSDRVQRVLLYSGACCEEPFFSTEHAGVLAAGVDSPQGRRLLAEFADAGTPLEAGRIYISDPLGNLMMKYESTADPKALRGDLGRLLKLSHIG
jgi:hypothetical protein